MKPILVLLVLTFFHYIESAPFDNVPESCPSNIYCNGDLLHDVQLSKLYPDSKTFVDKKLKYSESEILDKYKTLKSAYKGEIPPTTELGKFVDDNFGNGTELEEWVPKDWVDSPSILDKISDPQYKKWATTLNGLWRELSRKVIDDVQKNPESYSLVYVPNGFIIPGGRFRELYYWDSYWILNGILQCDMFITAKGVIENLLWLVKLFGHVPNGSRVYYLQRSQPPLLTMMVDSYLKATGDFDFLSQNINVLDKELTYWLENRKVDVKCNGKTHSMFHYNAVSSGPRPESYREDLNTVTKNQTKSETLKMYTAIKSAAESGWDFSSRWFIKDGSNEGNLSDIATPHIIPVDLNSFLQKDFALMSQWYGKLGNTDKMKQYSELAIKLQTAINNVLWNEKAGVWFDYDNLNKKSRQYFYMSNFAPLWTQSYNFEPAVLTKRILNYIKTENIDKYIGGSPTSNLYTGEQWDYPNAWAPLQSFLIQGLDRLNTEEASDAALNFANKWVYTNFEGFHTFEKMFEKYDATKIGKTGDGGEYTAQEGFGWTNGLIFELLGRWGLDLSSSK